MKIRSVLLPFSALVAVCVILPAHALPLTGRVILDRNNDGLAAADEPGMAGVRVSDGLTVCVTDAQGTYTLDTPALPALVRVTIPRDHRPVNGFWRWSPEGVPTDFLLVSAPQEDSFYFVQMTDSHLGRVDLFKQFIERLNSFPVPLAFVASTGDLVGGVDTVPVDKAMVQYDRYRDGVSGLRVPLFNLPGNHEHVAFQVKDADVSDPRYGKGLYRQVFGPMHYSWDWGMYHFVALDGTSLPYREKLGEEQLAWLKADLALTPPEVPLVLFCHQSLATLADASALREILAGRKVLAGFCGHLHETLVKKLGDIPVYHTGALSGSWWSGANPDGTPQGFALIRLADGAVDYVYSAREGHNASLYVSSPNASAIRQGTFPAEVTVLDFGHPVEVTGEVGGQPVALQQKTRGAYWSVWQGEVDTARVPDGLLTFTVTAGEGEAAAHTDARYLVINGKEGPSYQADADAVLKMRVRGIEADDEVWSGESRLGIIPAGTPNETEVVFQLPAANLKRLNPVTIKAAAAPGATDKDDFNVGPIWVEYKGKRLHDIRYVSFARHNIGDNKPASYSPERTFYYCLP